MPDGRRNNKGTKGNKGGRPPKRDEQKLLEKLKPLEELAHQKLKENIVAGEQWAVKMYFEYYYGKPKQIQEINIKSELPDIEGVLKLKDRGE